MRAAFGVVALLALCSVATAQQSGCVFQVGANLQIDLTTLSSKNWGPIPLDEEGETLYFRPCSTLEYDETYLPEDNVYCDETDMACILVDDEPAFAAGNKINSVFAAGEMTEVRIIGGDWVEEDESYRGIDLILKCGTGEGTPVFTTRSQYVYVIEWTTSAACPIEAPMPELPWNRTAFPTPTNVIYRGEYKLKTSHLPVSVEGYIVTSDQDALEAFSDTHCILTAADSDYYSCNIGTVGDIEIDIKDVAEFALVFAGTTTVYIGATSEYFVDSELPSGFDNNLFTFVNAAPDNTIPFAFAHDDRAVNVIAYTGGEFGKSATIIAEVQYQIAKAGTSPLTPGGKIGVLLGIIVAVILIIVGIYVCIRRRRNYEKV